MFLFLFLHFYFNYCYGLMKRKKLIIFMSYLKKVHSISTTIMWISTINLLNTFNQTMINFSIFLAL